MSPTISDRLRKIIKSDTLSGPKGGYQAQVVAFCNQKGGVGKTTTTVNLAAALALEFQRKVLVVDMDPQGHVELGLKKGTVLSGRNGSLSSVLLTNRGNVMDVIHPSSVTNLFYTPADKGLIETENILSSKIGKEFFLRNSFALARTHFEFILIDCPPNLGNLTLNALLAAHLVVIPCEISPLAVEGVVNLLETIETLQENLNHNLEVLGILPTRVDNRNVTINETIFNSLAEHFGDLVFSSRIYVNTDITKAQDAGEPIGTFAPRARGAENYRDFAGEFLTRLGKR